ncbi:transcriptional regulator, IclR family [Sphingopyxis sp. YR583]|uniref:IclR family transcriptional regulator n=1 Tax=Sphingopyxis sp. YR583 TaxID=1881047 RepID=UPI0008A7AA84|nr:IclR family transcriptional regulator [Sphingopyxis sp. YR583]SEH19133.1 transcriptional regulator, IclR family [Sphingopyxis sp. YR583]
MADTDKQPDDKTSRRKGIQSVEVGLNVLQAMASLGGPSALSAISHASNMAAPQVHRYLQSLIATGMATQDPSSGRYDLGPGALKLGLAALARTDAFRLVDSIIYEFSRTSGQTVLIAALGPLGPTVVRWYSGKPGVATSLTVGSVMSMIYSATGRIFLGFSPEPEIENLVAQEMQRAPMTPEELDAVRRDVRERGRAHVSGMLIPGLNATAFPVFDLQGRPILSATMVWPDAFDSPGQEQASEELAIACRAMSTSLGWSEEPAIRQST